MDIQSHLFLIPYGLAFLISLAMALYAWRRRDINGAGTYGWVVIGQAGYNLGYIMEHLYTSLVDKLLWNNVQLIAHMVWISAFALFALRYTNRILPQLERHQLLFLLPCLVYTALVLTSGQHDLIRQNVELNFGYSPPHLEYTPAIANWLWTAYAFAIGGIGMNALADSFIRTPKVYRTQIGTVILGNLLPMISALLTFVGIHLPGGHEATPLIILVGQLIVFWGLTRYRLYEIVPVAWHTVIKQMNDPVFILDPLRNIVDMNPAAEQLCNARLQDIKGIAIEYVVPAWGIPLTQFNTNEDTDIELAIAVESDLRYLRLHITPLFSYRDQHAGHALIAHDITIFKREQQELRGQSENLESQITARTQELQTAIEITDALNHELKREIEERRKVEENLRISQERYELATIAGHVAVWEWDREPDHFYAGAMLQAWMQTNEKEIGLKSDDWLHLIHPEDREYVENSLLQYAHGEIPELHLKHRVLLLSGEVRWFEVRATLIHDKDGGLGRMIGTDIDITESVRLLESLQKRDAALEAVNYVAEQLLLSIDWQEECDSLLTQLGEALQVDRALIYTFTQKVEGGFTTNLESEWHSNDIPPVINEPALHNVDTSGYERRFTLWQQGKPNYAQIRELPENEQRFERIMGIKTLLQMPIQVNGSLWGIISFHHVFAEREWSTAEIEALNTVANMFGTTIERQQTREALQQYTERLRILQEIDRAILAEESSPNIAAAALIHIRDLVPCKRASVMAFNEPVRQMQVLATITAGHSSVDTSATAPLDMMQIAFPELFEGQVFHTNIRAFEASGKRFPILERLFTEGIRAVVLIPLILQNKVVGSLNFGSVDDSFYNTLDMDALHEIANQLAIALQQAWLFEQVSQYAGELEERVRERTNELETLNEELQRLSKLKDAFVSNVSHELRTPIASLGLYHDLLLRRPDKLYTYVEALKRETTRLFNLVEDLLYLSRMDQERASVNLKRNDLNELIVEYVTDRMVLAEQKNLHLSLTQDADLPEVMMDRSMIGQVISIVMTNAFNYTPSGGEIYINTQQTMIDGHPWVNFSIRDTGPGIPIEEQGRLFDRFFRGNIAIETQVQGTGLGLAIAKEIIDRHLGYIEVQSTGIPGQGTTFAIYLPTKE